MPDPTLDTLRTDLVGKRATFNGLRDHADAGWLLHPFTGIVADIYRGGMFPNGQPLALVRVEDSFETILLGTQGLTFSNPN